MQPAPSVGRDNHTLVANLCQQMSWNDSIPESKDLGCNRRTTINCGVATLDNELFVSCLACAFEPQNIEARVRITLKISQCAMARPRTTRIVNIQSWTELELFVGRFSYGTNNRSKSDKTVQDAVNAQLQNC